MITVEYPPGSSDPTHRHNAYIYVLTVATAAIILSSSALLHEHSLNTARFISYLALTVIASTLKIRLPRLQETITPSFVLILIAIAQLTFAQTIVVAVVAATVQGLWRSARPPILAQIVFNPSTLALSAAMAYAVSRMALET